MSDALFVVNHILNVIKWYAEFTFGFAPLSFKCIESYYCILFLLLTKILFSVLYIYYSMFVVFLLLLLIWLFPYLVKDLRKNKWHEHQHEQQFHINNGSRMTLAHCYWITLLYTAYGCWQCIVKLLLWQISQYRPYL